MYGLLYGRITGSYYYGLIMELADNEKDLSELQKPR